MAPLQIRKTFSRFTPDLQIDLKETVQPDLAVYAAVDMSTLRDVRRTGMDYVLSMEALLHTTPGLKPGYLPEKDAHYLLDGVSISNH